LPVRLLAYGGRDFNDRELLFGILDDIHARMGVTCVIHGGDAGADGLAARWAGLRDIHAICFKADWDKYGRSAGPIRNDRMLRNGRPNLVVVFPGGSATADILARARKAGLQIMGIAPR
jgi:hypothetical protein